MSDLQDKTTNEQVADQLDTITNFDNLFEPDTPAEAAPAAKERDDAGRFSKKDAADPEAEAEDKAAPKAKDAKADDQADDEEDFVEVPAEEEGKEPARYKLTDLLAAHKRTAELEAEVTKYKASPALAPELETEIGQNIAKRADLIKVLQGYEAMMTPAMPDMRLAQSDPVEFASQMLHYNQAMQAQAAFKAEREKHEKEQAAQTETLTRAKHTREFERAVAEFPDLKDEGTRKKLVGDAVSKLGLTEQEVISLATSDHRNVRMMRLALEGLAARAAKETAAKVVAAKPKLVRAAARQSNSNGKAAQFEQAFGRVSQTHSIDDATRAIAALI